jgi:hypothetical protein
MQYQHDAIAIVCSDRTTAIVADTDVASYVMPWDFTLTEVQAQLLDAAGSGTFTIDVNDDSTSLLSTKLTIDAGETSSLTAAASFALVAATATTARAKAIVIARGSKVSIDIDDDAAGDALGLIVTLIGIRHL